MGGVWFAPGADRSGDAALSGRIGGPFAGWAPLRFLELQSSPDLDDSDYVDWPRE